LKGKLDLIHSAKKSMYNATGNAGMTIAGTGDVLAGVTAALLAQSKDPFYASCLAAYINGAAGDAKFKETGIGFFASEVIDKLPDILRKHRSIV
jgi:ADP-dependent NAD(P)H-hydrate dehydratase / NAD(P)H-hydrate epimerase